MVQREQMEKKKGFDLYKNCCVVLLCYLLFCLFLLCILLFLSCHSCIMLNFSRSENEGTEKCGKRMCEGAFMLVNRITIYLFQYFVNPLK